MTPNYDYDYNYDDIMSKTVNKYKSMSLLWNKITIAKYNTLVILNATLQL